MALNNLSQSGKVSWNWKMWMNFGVKDKREKMAAIPPLSGISQLPVDEICKMCVLAK